MDEQSGIGKVLRDITQAYMDGLSKIGSTISNLGAGRMPDRERQVERWVGVARAAKDGYVAAIDQGFKLWERQIRSTITPSESHPGKEGKHEGTTSQFDAWVENWRKANESFTESLRESGLGEEALKQARDFRKTLENGLKDLQKVWQSVGKSA